MILTYLYSEIPLFKKMVPGKKIVYMPMGYSKYYEDEYNKCKNIPTKDIDVLFYGRHNSRREKMINILKKAGIKVVWVQAHGITRTKYIKRSKIVININQIPPYGAQWSRLIFLISNKILVISETAKDEEFLKLKEYIPMFKTPQEMINICKYWLSTSDDEKRRLTDRAYTFVKTQFNMSDLIPIDDINTIVKDIQ